MRAIHSPAMQSQPNVTPMIDVMLVLLIIFMVVTPALLEQTPLLLPQAVNLKPRPVEETDHTLAIGPRGEYYLDMQAILESRLPIALHTLYAHREIDRVLYVRADAAVDYSRVLDAFDAAEKAGVRVVGMIAQPKSALGAPHG